MKLYYVQYNIGGAKYVLNYYDGKKTHKDGSPFWDIEIFSSSKDLGARIKQLKQLRYKIAW